MLSAFFILLTFALTKASKTPGSLVWLKAMSPKLSVVTIPFAATYRESKELKIWVICKGHCNKSKAGLTSNITDTRRLCHLPIPSKPALILEEEKRTKIKTHIKCSSMFYKSSDWGKEKKLSSLFFIFNVIQHLMCCFGNWRKRTDRSEAQAWPGQVPGGSTWSSEVLTHSKPSPEWTVFSAACLYFSSG